MNELPIAKPSDFQLGDVCTFGDSPIEFVVVDAGECARFAHKDSAEARRVLATVRQRADLNARITASFKNTN